MFIFFLPHVDFCCRNLLAFWQSLSWAVCLTSLGHLFLPGSFHLRENLWMSLALIILEDIFLSWSNHSHSAMFANGGRVRQQPICSLNAGTFSSLWVAPEEHHTKLEEGGRICPSITPLRLCEGKRRWEHGLLRALQVSLKMCYMCPVLLSLSSYFFFNLWHGWGLQETWNEFLEKLSVKYDCTNLYLESISYTFHIYALIEIEILALSSNAIMLTWLSFSSLSYNFNFVICPDY